MDTLLFGKYSTKDVLVKDIGLSKYINLGTPLVPHSHGRLAKKAWRKGAIPVVERLINKMMRTGQGKRKLSGKFIRGRGITGNKLQSIQIVERAFEMVEKESKENPLQILVRAIENAAPREDTTRIQKGGIAYSVAVDVSPIKRIDEALKNLALAAFQQSYRTGTSGESALAKELILASKSENQSYAIKRRDEIERIAKSSR